MTDLSKTILAKSDQLNADDLVAGPIVVQVTKVTCVDGDQPVSVHLTGGHRPWKPSKTARRVLVKAWGDNGDNYVGKWLRLFRDDDVKWAGKAVGGIRIAAMSDIPSSITISLAVSKGTKLDQKIAVLTPPANGKPTVDPAFAAFGAELVAATKNGWSSDQVKALLGCPAAEVSVERRAEIVARLKLPPDEAAA